MNGFRTTTEADVDAIVEMMRRYYAEDGYPFVESEARRAVVELIQDQGLGRLWVVQGEDGVVGYLAVTLGYSLEYRGRDAFLDELFIAESHRRQGLGREALGLAEAYCRSQGVRALHLEVERHREPALGLYRQAGFVDHDRQLMTKWLESPPQKNP
jgi:GNAT superfamily N-acetyltransferase